MATEIYLVRHGETEWNVLGKFQGATDIPLSQKGIEQASYLTKRFENKFDYVYSSPLKRAIQTASILSKNSGLKINIKEGIKEIDFGKWEGLTLKQIKDIYGKEYASFENDDTNGYLVGGDLSLKLASQRAKKTILEVAEECKNKTAVIVAHGGIIKAGLIGIFGWKMTMYHRILLGNTAVSKVVFDESLTPYLMGLNDMSHLPQNYRSEFLV